MSNLLYYLPTQRPWLTSMAAWLSVCIIASAWGNRLLPNDWQNVWGSFGLFGLAAALGLASIASARERAARKLVRMSTFDTLA